MSESKPIAPGPRQEVKELLPPVQPPTSGFLLQLFFIPLLIVLIIVVVWMLFSWLAHMGTSPRELVKELGRRNNASWQRAVTLGQILEAAPSGDPNGIRADRQMATEIAQILKDVHASGAKDESSVKLAEFLCSALGKFEVDEGLDALIEVAGKEKDDALLPARSAAVDALAELISRLIENPQTAEANLEQLRANAALRDRLIETTRDIQEISAPSALETDEIRSRAAYALGLIGGEQALDRLAAMIQDRSSNARNNAAFGLARHGDARALRGVVEMLNPANEAALLNEDRDIEKKKTLKPQEIALNKDWKRSQVLQNGLNTAKLLIARNQADDLTALEKPLDDLTHVELEFFRENLPASTKERANQDIRTKAKAVKKLLEERGAKGK